MQNAIISEVNSAIKALKDSKSLSDWAKRTEISNFENQKQNKNTQNYGTENYKPTDEFRRVQEASRKFLEQGVSKFQRKEEEFNNEDKGRLGGVLGRQLESASHDGRYDFKSDLTHTNKNGSVGHFKVGRVDGQLFHDIFEVVRTYLPHGELVDLHDDYSNAKCFITDDGLCGFAVEPDGNLVSVFSLSPDTNKGFLYAIKDLVRAEGATHLDAYGSKHQNLEVIYAKTLGFHTASTMDYNMEYDHDGIAENHGNPNVVFMVDHEVAKPKHFDKDSYDAAQQYQLEQVSKHGLVSQLTTHLKSMGIEVHGKKDMEEFLKNHNPEGLQKFMIGKKGAGSLGSKTEVVRRKSNLYIAKLMALRN